MIKLNNVQVTYPNGHTAVKNISVSIKAGAICGLVGMNGAGKSTLFKLIMGLVKPTEGVVLINDKPVKSALKSGLISYVPQAEEIDWDFPVLVKDLVMMGRYGFMNFLRVASARDHFMVDQSLARVGMQKYANHQIGELSGGQKKRVFLARALAQESRLILLDEPFAGVDTNTEKVIIELLKDLIEENKLVLVSTHNLGSVPDFCDDVMLINRTLLDYGPINIVYTENNLIRTFGQMLRSHNLMPNDLHKDKDRRAVTVLTDDERPLVFYGEQGYKKIVSKHNA